MLRKMSAVIVAGMGALSFAGAAAAYGNNAGYPTSVNETGPSMVNQAMAPSMGMTGTGATYDSMPTREVGSANYEGHSGSANYEVHTPGGSSERASG